MTDPTLEARLTQALKDRDRLRALVKAVVDEDCREFLNDRDENGCCRYCEAPFTRGVDEEPTTEHRPDCLWLRLVADAEVSY